MSVKAFLISFLLQSPALWILDILLNASIPRYAFRALSLKQGTAPCLEQLYIMYTPIHMGNSGLLEDMGRFYAMILSRLSGHLLIVP